jgi:3-hydroxyisobutyrate dehydrogenase
METNNTTPTSPHLPQIADNCWEMMAAGVSNRNSIMHQAVVATLHGNTPIMRTVILRRVDIQEKKIFFHTDFRSHKVTDILQNPHVSWLFYDQAQRTQLRMSGATIVHHLNECAALHWEKTTHHSRRSYMIPTAPSTLLASEDTGMNESLTGFQYTLEESEVGYNNFAVVETSVDWLEWYFTHHTGNKRAFFEYKNTILSHASWVMA